MVAVSRWTYLPETPPTEVDDVKVIVTAENYRGDRWVETLLWRRGGHEYHGTDSEHVWYFSGYDDYWPRRADGTYGDDHSKIVAWALAPEPAP